VRYIGPELGDPDWVNDNIWENPWSDANEKPLVVVSFSSTFQNQAGAIQNSMDALQELPVNGIVTLGPAMENHRFNIPSNVHVLESVKHSDLFPHADVVITHGGHGTVIRALSHGLPILCMPMGRDQDDNAIKVKMKGCGLNLSPKATAAKIRKAVKKILGDKNFLTNAKKMSALIREKAETSDPVEAIDTLLSIKEEATI
jgi:MGT family glycosyltransferase